MNIVEFLLASVLAASLPLLLAALGEMVVERAGLLNLGLEGMMAIGAAIAFIVVFTTGSHGLGLLFGGGSAAILSLVFALMVITFHVNQVAAGLAISVLGVGLSALFGKNFESFTVSGLSKLEIPFLSDIPVLGQTLLKQDLFVWLAIAFTFLLWIVLNRTKIGLVVQAIGENPEAARALGYPVSLIQYGAVAFGGAMAGFGGAYASTIYTPLWADGMIAGRGWIALALVVFGSWRTGRIALGAILFGALSVGELVAQAAGINLPSQLLSSLPYIATIVVLVIIQKRLGDTK